MQGTQERYERCEAERGRRQHLDAGRPANTHLPLQGSANNFYACFFLCAVFSSHNLGSFKTFNLHHDISSLFLLYDPLVAFFLYLSAISTSWE